MGTLVITGITFMGCKSSSEKVEDARNELKSVQNDSSKESQKGVDVEEWKIFRNESQAKIKNNQLRINYLKKNNKQSGIPGKVEYKASIDSLESKNNELVIRMDNYSKGKSDWETFKLEFKRDLDNLGIALQNFTEKTNGK